jgi:WD40 repeat protein
MTDVFISYSRKDIAFARLLHQALAENELETWIDWQDIPPSADWLAEVYEAIEGADAFVFVISETSLGSEICGLEISHAAKHNKRLIPIVIKDVDAGMVPKELAVLNWIFFEEAGEKFAEAMEDLVTAITADQPWIKAHTRFENRALEWEKKEGDRGLLLRGGDLTEAETWLAGSAGKDPQPTALQTQYILKSREDSTRRQRLTLTGVGIGLVVAVGLGILAWTQRNVAVAEGHARATAQSEAESAQVVAESAQAEAESQARLARAGQLSVEALSHLEDDFPLSLLLSVEAVKYAESIQSRSSLLTIISHQPQLENSFFDFLISATNAVYSPDGSLLVTAGCAQPGPSQQTLTCDSAELIFYDAVSGDLLERVSTAHPGFTSRLVFSPDGSQLASSDWHGNIILWDVASRDPLGDPLKGPSGRVLDILFTPDGKTLLASYEVLGSSVSPIGGQVWYWDTRTMKTEQTIPRPTTLPYSGMVLTSDGNRVITIQIGSSSLALRDLNTFERIKDHFSGNTIVPRSMAISPDGGTLALGNHNGIITFWDVRDGIPQPNQIAAHKDSISDIAYSSDGTRIVSVSSDQTIRVWDAETLKEIGDPFASVGRLVKEITFLPDSQQFAAASVDGSVTVWNLDAKTALATRLIGHSDAVWDADIASTGDVAASISADGTVRIWALSPEPSLERVLTTGSGQLYAMAFSPDDSLLAVGGQLGLEIWDWQKGERLYVNRTVHTEPIVSLVFSPDGELLATGGMDAQITLWDPLNGETVGDPLQGHQSVVNDLAFSPDSSKLLSVGCSYATSSTCESGQILLWTLEGKPELSRQIEAHDRDIYDIEISPDGSQFATASTDETVLLWDMQSGDRLGEPILGHEFGVVSLAYSQDGTMLASGGTDQKIMITDLISRKRIGPLLEGHQGVVNTLSFSPSGDLLLSGSHDEMVFLWPMETGLWQSLACERAGRNLTQTEWATYLSDLPYLETCQNQ